ncbi:MAG: pyridoxamine 5'-phosphate oxidase family protein [Thermoflexaceae bacterium]|nr:pyridoxamine 5'-phosphate oxidase family protein [Thermoflexaceae bacterium]
MVWDKDHLAWWERAHGTTLRNLQENPQVSLLYRNPAKRQAWKYFGAVELLSDGPVREGIMARTPQVELDRDPERKGIAVLIRVDKVMQAGQLFQER